MNNNFPTDPMGKGRAMRFQRRSAALRATPLCGVVSLRAAPAIAKGEEQ